MFIENVKQFLNEKYEKNIGKTPVTVSLAN